WPIPAEAPVISATVPSNRTLSTLHGVWDFPLIVALTLYLIVIRHDSAGDEADVLTALPRADREQRGFGSTAGTPLES
ncbi:MAG TPA: hypothetical protein VH496_20100, partial [Mycobacterium sp.]